MKDSAQEARILALATKQGITLDPCLLKDYPLGTVFWAVHHSVMAEPLTEPLANRIEYILTEKDASERAIRLTALRPMKVVPGKLAKASAEWDKAYAKWDKAYAKLAKASAKWDKASAEWDKVSAEWDKAYAKWDKAYAEWDKAYAERAKAYAERDKAYALKQWDAEYPDHPAWNAETGLVFTEAKE
jgi:hypothetical protein